MNRYLLAKTLNVNDELVWYKKTKTKYVKCVWRRINNGVTFMSQRVYSEIDKKGFSYLKAGNIDTVFTLIE